MMTQPAPGEPGPGTPGATRTPGASGQRLWPWLRRPQGVFAVVIAVAVIATIIVVAASGGHGGSGGSTSGVSVSAGSVNQVDLQAVPGQLTIVGAATGRVTLNGHLAWNGHAQPSSTTRMVSPHTLRLVYRCAAGSPCTAHWRLVVPRHTAVVLSQPSGHISVSGLGGALRITAASVDISATGLRSPSLTATITSGHLTAGFAAAPQKVDITLTSAQATLRLPANVSYAVSDQVISGYVHVGIPQAATAPRGVTARVVSGELELLPA
jgi:hypothetical protein